MRINKKMKKIFLVNDLLPADSERGAAAILLTVLILSVVLVIGLGASAIMLNQVKMSSVVSKSMKAFYAADAGVEKCLFEIGQSDSCNIPLTNLDNGSSFQSQGNDSSKMLQSAGFFNDTSRKIQVTWE
jgi:hypothetical protein